MFAKIMVLLKSSLMSMIILSSCNGAASDNNSATATNAMLNAAVLNAVVQVMKECYEVKHATGTHLAKCMLKVFHQGVFPNPQHYRVFITGDIPGNATLIIDNQKGFIMNCAILAQKTIQVTQCTDYQGSPLTSGQELSILPP